jgi:C1A family cysteine protease
MEREALVETNAGMRGLGWLPDLPDVRDLTPEQPQITAMLEQTSVLKAREALEAPPSKVDLRQYFSPIEDQGTLGSCTANAAVGLVEYFQRRAKNEYIDASRLFVYKATRNYLGWTGDTGAYLRSTAGALALFGAPPERFWPYDIDNFDVEPSAFCYAFGQQFQTIKYYRLDPAGTTPDQLLDQVRGHLASGLPSMFGFTVYSSISQANANGDIPFPAEGERVLGGHAIVAVGYDDDYVISNANGPDTTGALKIRNSWGADWGDEGYGAIPYEYIARGLAEDFWVILDAEWVKVDAFNQ